MPSLHVVSHRIPAGGAPSGTPPRRPRSCARWLTLLLANAAGSASVFAAGPDFGREVRPVLSQHCFKCHGPGKQSGGMRLDQPESVTRPARSGMVPIVPGKPDESEIMQRITSPHADEVMPPEEGGHRPLAAAEIAVIRDWIAAGAEYRPHWAYVPPVRPAPVAGADGNPIDALVRSRLAAAGLSPSPPAPSRVLARRLHLDLTGLPPAPEDVEAFVLDAGRRGDAAVDDLVDRLLASPRFGEKWARHWLDLARYADSAGYQHDDDMPLWLYRDWVIRAFNADLPFDQFTREQLAGDLLPGATVDQRIATGFNRAATVTLGADQNVDELRAMLVWDRVNTMGTTWLGSTLECAQCHAHKYDPVSAADYYRLYAYFNRGPAELTKYRGSHYFITGGILELPATPGQQARIEAIESRMRREIAALAAVPFDFSGEGESVGPIRRIVQGPPELRAPGRVYYFLTEELKGAGHPRFAASIARLRELGRERQQLLPPRALVLEDAVEPPVTHVLRRGDVRSPGEPVTPGTPPALAPPLPDAPPDRRGLADWLVSPSNPLTARVVVNRFWAELFGRGLVATPEDFGLQGEYPSHPELLDWLAVEFREGGWSMKKIIRTIVRSHTYQQDSRSDAAARQRDPSNRLLGRGPRQRLVAELLRDHALAIGGLLSAEMGGPPAHATPAEAGKAGEPFAWRRSIYLRQQRGAPNVTALTFDAPDRFACTPQRPTTNTPLQALAALNDGVFWQAAQGLARRTAEIHEPAARIDRMFRLCVARPPQPAEAAEAAALVAEAERESGAADLAWTLLANVLLNLDETLTKE